MQQNMSTSVPHDGLRILSHAVMQARRDERRAGAVEAMGYRCVPAAEPTGNGTWRAVVRAEGRGETLTVVGKTFATAGEAVAHAASVSLIDLYNGGTA